MEKYDLVVIGSGASGLVSAIMAMREGVKDVLIIEKEEDLGGNLIQLTFNRDQTNLHSLWDTKLVDYQRYSYKEFAKVLDYKSKEEIQKIQSGTLENWLYDSYTKANRIYTQTKPNGVYSYDYNYKFSGLLEEQLLTGGLRLAKVLDEILQ